MGNFPWPMRRSAAAWIEASSMQTDPNDRQAGIPEEKNKLSER